MSNTPTDPNYSPEVKKSFYADTLGKTCTNFIDRVSKKVTEIFNFYTSDTENIIKTQAIKNSIDIYYNKAVQEIKNSNYCDFTTKEQIQNFMFQIDHYQSDSLKQYFQERIKSLEELQKN
ncbi:MAG: hypothetical protein GY828_06500 [Candidatus Gracilibacteria bacterium]|nr:hypothetical protein [Candidatus Gracilibacteria bacterium]